MQDASKLTMVLDGFSAPLTAGNFALRVQQGEFNNRQLGVEFASVLCNPPLAEPEGEAPLPTFGTAQLHSCTPRSCGHPAAAALPAHS